MYNMLIVFLLSGNSKSLFFEESTGRNDVFEWNMKVEHFTLKYLSSVDYISLWTDQPCLIGNDSFPHVLRFNLSFLQNKTNCKSEPFMWVYVTIIKSRETWPLSLYRQYFSFHNMIIPSRRICEKVCLSGCLTCQLYFCRTANVKVCFWRIDSLKWCVWVKQNKVEYFTMKYFSWWIDQPPLHSDDSFPHVLGLMWLEFCHMEKRGRECATLLDWWKQTP